MSTKSKSRQQLQLLRDEALEAYLNREDFRFDLNADALYRQYADQYQRLGQKAMQDTMGQAAALTGGYGSSYAQSVGQQAYHSYLQQLGDVIPELYQLAYDRYRNRGDALYKAYQSWAQLEQEAADREQLDREYALKEQELRYKNSKEKEENDTYGDLPDYYAWYASIQGKGERPRYDDPTVVTKFDNGNVTTGNIMILQRVLGLEDTGMWTLHDRKAAGGMTADAAWAAYQKGQLQNRNSHALGDQGLANENVRAMERVLGLTEDGYWSAADQKAAGGMSEAEAWEAYQKGLLQLRR